MSEYLLDFSETALLAPSLVGGKGANLGELTQIADINVPVGFCLTTTAYQAATASSTELPALLQQLMDLTTSDGQQIRLLADKIHQQITKVTIPAAIEAEIRQRLQQLGDEDCYAVRSSATAEDLAEASFAGQQDTYLNISGAEAILAAIRQCWASLFNERAILYRMQNGFDQRQLALAVVIQKMIPAEAAGVMFTADPLNFNRRVLSIDAGFGLGEAVVSGLVTADNYRLRGDQILAKTIAKKQLEVRALPGGGTQACPVVEQRQQQPALNDGQLGQLAQLGRRIEEHFGCPQDIEWAMAGGAVFILQSRPITTLYPLPEDQDEQGHLYLSFGHQQMMTDAMKPLGLACFKYSSGGDGTLLVAAGSRLFMDISHDMATAFGRMLAVPALGQVDPLIGSALKNLVQRKEFIKSLARGKRFLSLSGGYFSPAFIRSVLKTYRRGDAATVPALMQENEQSIQQLADKLANLSGDELFQAIDEELTQLIKIIGDPRGLAAVWSGTLSVSWLNKHLEKWLGEKGLADVLAQSAANNVVGEMGLELLDIADVVRPHPAVQEYLAAGPAADTGAFFADLQALPGGVEVALVLQKFLAKYGCRCAGEIDITRPRWAEEPAALATLILSNIANFAPGAGQSRFDQGLRSYETKRQEISAQLLSRSGGQAKVRKLNQTIDRLRNFIGYREYPKYVMMRRYWLVKQALLREATALVQDRVLQQIDDMNYLSLAELRQVAQTRTGNPAVIAARRAAFAADQKLNVPRLMTSEGEVISGQYQPGNRPEQALPGIAAAAGVVEGRARVVLRLEDAQLTPGDILVTRYTDPSWTAAFVSISGLVTEVGGVMTHGSVVAREYGLPAVVGVDDATSRIADGQWIRVNGTDGYVEILPD